MQVAGATGAAECAGTARMSDRVHAHGHTPCAHSIGRLGARARCLDRLHGALAHLRARAASASACQLYVLARFNVTSGLDTDRILGFAVSRRYSWLVHGRLLQAMPTDASRPSR